MINFAIAELPVARPPRMSREALMSTSSSLGDDLVEPPRRGLFEQLIVRDSNGVAGQFRFHRHQWVHAPHISVCMDRGDVATASRTTIDLRRSGVTMAYEVC